MRGGLPTVAAGAVALVACGASDRSAAWDGTRHRSGRPDACRDVAPGELQTAIDAAAPNSALCLGAGLHPGGVVLRTPVTLWGSSDAVIATTGGGTTVRITAAGAALIGVTVRGSGTRFDQLDAAVLVAADDVVVRGVTILEAVHGILVEKAHRARLIGNHVRGGTGPAVGLRGDTIRLWETDDAEVAENLIEDGRDVVVWYSRHAVVRDNVVRRARYGTHFMYSHDGLVERNRYEGVTVGVFVMYTRGLALVDNVIANAGGAAGIGIGLKDVGATDIIGNVLVRDHVGIYLDGSPQRRDEQVRIANNQVRLCRTGIVFHASSPGGVVVRGNDFADDDLVVRVDGGGDAMRVAWTDNYFDDYAGYDLDDDGVGDVPFELRTVEGDLLGRRPELAFFRGTPAATLASAAARLDPLYRPRLVLVDGRPRMSPTAVRERGTAIATKED
jgi:nitrous oxidase accessory protein